MTKILHLGSGRKGKALTLPDIKDPEIITLDEQGFLKPDIVCKLGVDEIPLHSNTIDIAVAIHVLEHIGKQGETTEWFDFWEELYRVLKPGGFLYFESPLYNSLWAWSDPTHTRALSPYSFVYFSQDNYRVKDSSISPYRIRCDFKPSEFESFVDGNEEVRKIESVSHFRGEIHTIKPLHPWWED